MNNRTEQKLTDLSGMEKAVKDILKQAWIRGMRYGIEQSKEDNSKGDLISREALNDIWKLYKQYQPRLATNVYEFGEALRKLIDNAPTVDLTKNQAYDKGFITAMKLYARPQGEWINTSPYDDKGECSLCCYVSKKYYNFCPNCEAKMKGGEEE